MTRLGSALAPSTNAPRSYASQRSVTGEYDATPANLAEPESLKGRADSGLSGCVESIRREVRRDATTGYRTSSSQSMSMARDALRHW